MVYFSEVPKPTLTVAAFTMEVGLRRTIPTYAGGLGILMADLLRSSADLGVDAACVTVCWQYGYLRQHLKADGAQEYEEVQWEPARELQRLPQTVKVWIDGWDVVVGAWFLNLRGERSSVPIFFLDTNLPENRPEDRAITEHLYGGDQAMRLKQELVLGIGGVRMLRALGYGDVRTFHLNEGHAAFLTLELQRERGFRDDDVRKSCVFTTHTPVKAGHDIFPYDLAKRIAGDHLPWHIKMIAGEEALSMTRLATTMSHKTFGVSQVHGEVARRILENPEIDFVTNGVHHVMWACEPMRSLFDRHMSGWREDPKLLESRCRDLPDNELWAAHREAKRALLDEVNTIAEVPFDLDHLLIASARRIVPYKRPELLYTNLARLKEVGAGHLQIIHAGNAHPSDTFSQEVIRNMIARSRELRDCIRIVYLPNYNPDLAKLLTSGADIWLNTPMRLHEASGTSGMKACLNGVLNLSTLDGWWVEGFRRDPGAGWRIGPLASALPDDEDTLRVDAEDLYTQLQYKVIPEYTYSDHVRWIRRMKRAIGLIGHFNTHRCVEEYLEKAWVA